ncbi:keratin, type I cytoskeletal 15 [Osmerus mordax]|uniref:keratin, type I cytoskeletal 15 n=1 Tax=Osmerus mordax TaxID=8014 RepID=UPI00350EB38A
MGSGGGGGAGFGAGMGGGMSIGFTGNEKLHMQSLNDRLAHYLDQVRMLETTNRQLEEKLKSFTAAKIVTQDFTVYDHQLKPLRDQLLSVMLMNTYLALEIDNAKLAADDFRMKWETEMSVRQTVEGDIAGLRALQRDYNSANQALVQDLNLLMEEHATTMTIHQQDLASLHGRLGGTVNVEMAESRTSDLAQAMADIRAEYEAVVENNRRQAEGWYMTQVEMKKAQVMEVVTSESSDMSEGRNHATALQIELEAFYMANANLDDRLSEVGLQFHQRLVSGSKLVSGLEQELASVREGAQRQAQDYQMLLDIKSRLEVEITTYKQLLEGAGGVAGGAGGVAVGGGRVSRSLVTEMRLG